MKLSVITPVYKGGERFGPDFRKKYDYLRKTFNVSFEMVYVLDGEEGNNAIDIEKIVEAQKLTNVRIIKRAQNRGKGFSVREGFEHANGKYLCFIDFDPEVPVEYIGKMYRYLARKDGGLCIGNRFSKDSNYEVSCFRKTLSRGFLLYNKLLFGLKFPDSQAGLKMIKRKSYDLIKDNLEADRFAFDIEFILMALKHGVKVASIPIDYIRDENVSTINLKTPINMAIESIVIWKKIKG